MRPCPIKIPMPYRIGTISHHGAGLGGLVVIAEDLGRHVLFFRLDDGFLPARPGKRLKRGNGVLVRHDGELGLVAPAAPTQAMWEHPGLRLHRGDAGLEHEALELTLFPR